MKNYFSCLIQDKGKRKEYAIYSTDSDGAFDDYENVVRINTVKESIEQYIAKHYDSKVLAS